MILKNTTKKKINCLFCFGGKAEVVIGNKYWCTNCKAQFSVEEKEENED